MGTPVKTPSVRRQRAIFAWAGAAATLFSPACSELTRPAPGQAPASEAAVPPSPTQPPPPSDPARAGDAPAVAAPAPEKISAAHIVVAYTGAERAPSSLMRSKQEAKEKADALLVRLGAGTPFAELARAESDGPSALQGGDLGTFSRTQVSESFANAAFALAPGETSGVVETAFGFHIIRRSGERPPAHEVREL